MNARAHVWCKVCRAIRYCDRHARAEFPPDAAKRWLERACRAKGHEPALVYQAGATVRGNVVGQ